MATDTTAQSVPNSTTPPQNSSAPEHPELENAVNGVAEDQATSPQNNVTGDTEAISDEKKTSSDVPQAEGTALSRRSADNGLGPAASSEHPPSSTHAEKAEATETTIASSDGPKADADKDRDKDKGSTSTTLSGTQTHSQPSRPSKRKPDNSTSSSEKKSSKRLAKQKISSKAPQPSKESFLSKLVKKFFPCTTVSRSHPIDLSEGVSVTLQPKKSVQETTDAKETENDTTLKEKEAPPAPEAQIARPIIVPSLSIPPATIDPEVILPPTPTKQLLPQSETAGLTSGAVVPPGSSGEPIEHQRVHTRDSGDESEGTSFTEDDDDGNGMDDGEDEEDRLIMNGGAGIPIGPDGVPRPLLPPLAPHHAGRKCLVLDLDETLVHSSFKSIQQADYVVPVEIEYHWHNVYVIKRPGVDNFLKKMGEIYEIVVFTASLSKYADPVLDKLDMHQVVSHRLFRESCYNHKGNYVKDLSQLGRPIQDTIILDNSPASYIFHPNNAVPVSSWFNDPHDTELTDLCPFLADLSGVDDVRGVLDGGL